MESSELREARDSLREEISQNLNENLTEHEVVTWTVTGLPLTAYGLQERDTLKVERVTHRELESGSRFKAQSSKVEVRTVRDTVYIEKRDSSLRLSSLGAYGLREDGTPTVSGKLSAVSKVLKWIFWILIGLIGLIVTAKVCLLRR